MSTEKRKKVEETKEEEEQVHWTQKKYKLIQAAYKRIDDKTDLSKVDVEVCQEMSPKGDIVIVLSVPGDKLKHRLNIDATSFGSPYPNRYMATLSHAKMSKDQRVYVDIEEYAIFVKSNVYPDFSLTFSPVQK